MVDIPIITDVLEGLQSIIGLLVEVITTGIFLVLYPIGWTINIIADFLDMSLMTLLSFTVQIAATPGTIIDAIITPLTNLFPNQWIILMTSLLALNVGLRIYSFIKGVSLLGFGV
jgi:hypothetical protein